MVELAPWATGHFAESDIAESPLRMITWPNSIEVLDPLHFLAYFMLARGENLDKTRQSFPFEMNLSP